MTLHAPYIHAPHIHRTTHKCTTPTCSTHTKYTHMHQTHAAHTHAIQTHAPHIHVPHTHAPTKYTTHTCTTHICTTHTCTTCSTTLHSSVGCARPCTATPSFWFEHTMLCVNLPVASSSNKIPAAFPSHTQFATCGCEKKRAGRERGRKSGEEGLDGGPIKAHQKRKNKHSTTPMHIPTLHTGNQRKWRGMGAVRKHPRTTYALKRKKDPTLLGNTNEGGYDSRIMIPRLLQFN